MTTLVQGDTVRLDDDGRAWPVVDGVPFLRVGREDLRRAALAALHVGDTTQALALLLRDADDWWDEEPPTVEQAQTAARTATLRDAMAGLRLGRVGDYFAYRWSDPVFVAGLALLRRAWSPTHPFLEVAAGTGSLVRELALHGAVDLTVSDVVLAKLWLSRRFVMPETQFPDVHFLCFDAGAAWPVTPGPDRVVICHDALYFLPDPATAAATMRALAGSSGSVVVGGIPNGLLPAVGGGHRLRPQDLADLLPGAELFADPELVVESIEGVTARPRTPSELTASPTVSAVWRGPDAVVAERPPDLAVPPTGRPLRLNPLYGADGVLRWPSERYARDYADRSPYLPPTAPSAQALAADREGWARRRVLLDLPDAW